MKPSEMTMGQLIVSAARLAKKAEYFHEIDRRITIDPSIPDKIDRALGGTLSPYAAYIKEEKPPGTQSEAPRAKIILNSSWDFSGLRSSPEDVRHMCQDVADQDLSEERMASDQQRKFWRAIKSHFHQWERSR
jgi:hypothetical protein